MSKPTLPDFWKARYLEHHKVPHATFCQKDAVILYRALDQVKDKQCLAWCIDQYHRIRDDEWVVLHGWPTNGFKSRLQGLLIRFAREVREPRLEAEAAVTKRELKETAEHPKILSLLDRIEERQARQGGGSPEEIDLADKLR